jgi:hypothetical protein
MKVFSFCIYGTERNYYDGLLENIQIIREYFPDFTTYIYKGICDPSWTFEGDDLKIIETGRDGGVNMFYRFLPVTFAEIGFWRDADSRIGERDRWCISEFMKSDKLFHITRDHFWHKAKIMGCSFGWKKTIPYSFDIANFTYGDDELYIGKHIYPQVVKDALVHTSMHAFEGEHVEPITFPHKDKYDFVGNVIWNGAPKFEYYMGDTLNVLTFLMSQKQYDLVRIHTNNLKHSNMYYNFRNHILSMGYMSNYHLKNVEGCQFWLSKYEFGEVSSIYPASNLLFAIMNKKIVASFDPEREPASDEVVIVYGNYPEWHHALPASSKVLRHVSRFFDVQHDSVEYDPSWEFIQTIYVLNLEDRSDRFNDTMVSLCAVKAPLHRVHHYKAKKDGLAPYIGATKNHVDVIQHFVESGNKNCLILEDDIVFIDDHKKVWKSLTDLSSRKYDYTLCFLAISKMGERNPMDDLLSVSRQECTTSSAYILQKSTAQAVLETTKGGLEKMIGSGDQHNFCIDRYWTKLPSIYFFKTKLAYQRPSYSNLTKQINFHLD